MYLIIFCQIHKIKKLAATKKLIPQFFVYKFQYSYSHFFSSLLFFLYLLYINQYLIFYYLHTQLSCPVGLGSPKLHNFGKQRQYQREFSRSFLCNFAAAIPRLIMTSLEGNDSICWNKEKLTFVAHQQLLDGRDSAKSRLEKVPRREKTVQLEWMKTLVGDALERLDLFFFNQSLLIRLKIDIMFCWQSANCCPF